MNLVAIGVGGVLYPPHIFDSNIQYFNETDIKEICLNADDIWLKYLEAILPSDKRSANPLQRREVGSERPTPFRDNGLQVLQGKSMRPI